MRGEEEKERLGEEWLRRQGEWCRREQENTNPRSNEAAELVGADIAKKCLNLGITTARCSSSRKRQKTQDICVDMLLHPCKVLKDVWPTCGLWHPNTETPLGAEIWEGDERRNYLSRQKHYRQKNALSGEFFSKCSYRKTKFSNDLKITVTEKWIFSRHFL